MRVENDTDEPHVTAEEFTIKDTQGNEFEPVELDPELNLYGYEPVELPAGQARCRCSTRPPRTTRSAGRLLLYKLKTESLGNRPVELEIASPSGGEGAVIDLDI